MSINKLIFRGYLSIYIPIFSFWIIVFFGAEWIFSEILHFEKVDFFSAVTTLLAIPISWIWWSYKVVKWKYWAFSNVSIEKAESLHNRAIEIGLIWSKNSFFNKTEIWTKKDKENWNSLDKRLNNIPFHKVK